MKNPSHPPPKPLTAKRKKILALAMVQLKKTRAQMDPSILKKIRSIIARNPKIMKGLGLDKMPDEPSLKPVLPKAVIQPSITQKDNVPSEKIDQAHNMEVMAKLMALKPQEIENIKAVLMNSSKD